MKKPHTTEPELLPADNQTHYQPPESGRTQALAVRDSQPLDVARTDVPNPAEMMRSMIQSGVTAENVAAFTELVKLSEHMEDRNAAREFARAFVELQRAIPRIKATKIIPDKHGNVRSSFAPFEEIDSQARPICLEHGFTYTFSEGEFQQGKITKICTLTHIGGHSRSNPYTVRIGQGPPGCSESQADGAAHSYAKRGALCDALNIVVTGIDTDARMEGGKITAAQAEELERRVALLNQSHPAFLKWLGADKYENIAAAKYTMADEFLRKKEQGK